MDRHLAAVEQRALLSDESGVKPDLKAVLAGYSEAITSGRAAVDFRKVTRRTKVRR